MLSRLHFLTVVILCFIFLPSRYTQVMGSWTNETIYITGFTILPSEIRKKTFYDTKGRLNAYANTKMLVRVFGKFSANTYFKFSRTIRCADRADRNEVQLRIIDGSASTAAEAHLILPSFVEDQRLIYMCLHEGKTTSGILQGKYVTTAGKDDVYPWLTVKLLIPMLPLWIHILLVLVLLLLSALFSGLNLGLLSLDKTDLKVIINTGSQKERSEASKIVPVRNHGNFLLCCLVFSNVLVNTTLTLLMDQIFSGNWETVAVTTLAIVMIGEILPQAVCSRYGLTVGAKTIWITKFFMFISFPLAYPVGKILDIILGEEIGAVYTRDRLKELLKATRDQHGLETEEMGIIAGALDMKSKTVRDVMTPIDQMFMIPMDAVLDFDLLQDIEYRGFTRIPIFQESRTNVVAILNVKQLTLVDPGKKVAVNTLADFYKTNLFFVFENEKLDVMFRAFREGNRGHMAFVQRLNDEGPGDPYYETVGIVTMEDVLEELLQAEIYDENDVERSQGRLGVHRAHTLPFEYKKTKAIVSIQPQLALAATQYLVTSVEPFRENKVSVTIVQRLMSTNVHHVKFPKLAFLNPGENSVLLYEAGKSAEHFMMILEGKVRVQVGKEKLVYEAGAFSTFGVELLINYKKDSTTKAHITGGKLSTDVSKRKTDNKKVTFTPDYTVKVLSDVYILKVTLYGYSQARIATELERMYCTHPEKAAEKPDWPLDVAKILEEAIE